MNSSQRNCYLTRRELLAIKIGCIVTLISTIPHIFTFVLFVLFQYDWLVAQVHEKDVLKYITEVYGELCVMITSMTQLQELFVTCSDTGRVRLSKV